jgi:Domain of unknown function (DUF4833)
MNIYILFLLTVGLSQRASVTDKPIDAFPEPKISENHLFYIQRSNDINTVMYEANILPDKRIDKDLPINVYWIRYAEKGQKEKLSALQWQLAYGYKQHSESPGNQPIKITLNAFKKRCLYVYYNSSKPVAVTQINRHKSILKRIFVQLASTDGLIPKVHYIELFGVDMTAQNQAVSERIYVQ